MTGTLELLCGPSGVGKTSSVKGHAKSYRWTTRPPREAEENQPNSELMGADDKKYALEEAIKIIEQKGIFESKFAGFFVSEEKFLERAKKGELAGIHRYPYPKTGHLYGFPMAEITAALDAGAYLAEQTVDYEAIDDVVSAFEKKGTVRKILFLSGYDEVQKRLVNRNKTREEYLERLAITKELLKKYLANINSFDEVKYSFPKLLNVEESNEAIQQMIECLKNNRGFVMEYELGAGAWQEHIESRYGYLLDLMIQINMVEKALNGEEIPKLIEPECQFNLKYTDDPAGLPAYLSSKDPKTIRKIYETLQHKLEQLEPQKAALVTLLEAMKKTKGFFHLRRIYHSAFKKEINPVAAVAENLIIRNMPEIASILGTLKLYYDVVGWPEDLQQTLKLKKNLIAIRDTGEIQDEDFMTKIITKYILAPLKNRDEFVEQLAQSKEIVRIYPNEIDRNTINLFKREEQNKSIEFGLSYASMDLKNCLGALERFIDFTAGDHFGKEIKRMDFLPAVWAAVFEDLDTIKLLDALTSHAGFIMYTPNYFTEAEQIFGCKVDFLKEAVNTLDKINDHDVIVRQIMALRKSASTRLIIPSISNLENKAMLSYEALEPRLETFKEYVDAGYLEYLPSLMGLDTKLTCALNVYASFRHVEPIRRMTEVESVIFMDEFNAFLIKEISKKGYDPWLFRYLFSINLNYLKTLKRIMAADQTKPNSRENLWAYPLLTDPAAFFKEYFALNFLSPEESYRGIKETISDIQSATKQREQQN